MRYRIVIEVETDQPRSSVNALAHRLMDEAVTRDSKPVYLATEVVTNKQRNIFREVE